MLNYTYFGHSCFLLDDGKYKVLTDPFLTENPLAAAKPEDIECDYILVSHGHFDHLGQAEEIAKRTGAQVLATACPWCKANFEKAGGMEVKDILELALQAL